MKRLSLSFLLSVLALSCILGVAGAQSKPEFRLGFKALADQIPTVVGQPIEEEHWGANGDSLQQTTTGLMVWRKADNWTAFTNGSRTWINGPTGVVERNNDERFDWEAPPPPAQPITISAAPTPTPQALGPTATPVTLPFSDWQPAPGASGNRPIQGVIDGPKPGAHFSGTIAVYGWVADSRALGQPNCGVVAFKVFADGPEGSGRKVDGKTDRSVRQDVGTNLGNPAYSNSGFYIELDRSQLGEGNHTFFVYAYSAASGWWYKTITAFIELPKTGYITMEGKQYLTSLSWAQHVTDSYLRGALAIAYDSAPDFRPIADAAAEQNAVVSWGDLPSGIGGLYSPRDNTITISNSIRNEPTIVAAAFLAHEAFHAARRGVTGAFDCFQDEITAYRVEAYTWSKIPKNGRSYTGPMQFLDALWWAWGTNDDTMKNFVLTSPGYQMQCLGGVVR